jgi:hypothetical protein
MFAQSPHMFLTGRTQTGFQTQQLSTEIGFPCYFYITKFRNLTATEMLEMAQVLKTPSGN